MSFSSYIACGLQSASMFSDDGDDSGSYFSVMDYIRDFPLCCQDNEGVEAIFRPIDTEEPSSGPEAIAHGNMITPWRPPLYRDTSLVAAPSYPRFDEESPASASKILTPSVGIVSCDDSIPSQNDRQSRLIKNYEAPNPSPLPTAFIPPKHTFSRSFEADKRDRRVDSPPRPSSYLGLQPKDVVCGRGAPTSTHPGNLAFIKIIKKYEMEYVCSKRNEKPNIATSIMTMLHSDGVRFVKRERNTKGSFEWVEIGEQRVFEKVCQSLREDAPQLRRQMLASEVLRSTRAEKQRQSQNWFQQRRQDLNTRFSNETSNDHDVRHQPSFAALVALCCWKE